MNECDSVLKWGRVEEVKYDNEIMQHYALDELISEGSSSSDSSFDLTVPIPDLGALGFGGSSANEFASYFKRLRTRYDYTAFEKFLMANYQSDAAIEAWTKCVEKQALRFYAKDEGGDRYKLILGFGDPLVAKPLNGVSIEVSDNATTQGDFPTDGLVGNHEILVIRDKDSTNYREPIDITLSATIQDGPPVTRAIVIPPKPEPLLIHSFAHAVSGYNSPVGPTEYRYTGEKEGYLILYLRTRAQSYSAPWWAVHPNIRVDQINDDNSRTPLLSYGPATRHGNRDNIIHEVIKPNTLIELSGSVSIASGSGSLGVFVTTSLGAMPKQTAE